MKIRILKLSYVYNYFMFKILLNLETFYFYSYSIQNYLDESFLMKDYTNLMLLVLATKFLFFREMFGWND